MIGEGYLRRKATRNLGKSFNTPANAVDKPAKDGTLAGFINPLKESEKATEIAMIFDEGGGTVIGWDYIRMGEREGWLRHTGMHIGNRGIVYQHYNMVNAP